MTFSNVDVESVPESSVHPREMRLGDAVKKEIPVVDFSNHDRGLLVRKILDVSHEFGFFQMINHGVPKELLEDTMSLFKEFHGMSKKEKLRECSKVPDHRMKFYRKFYNTSSIDDHMKQGLQSWKDSVAFNCYPLEKYAPFWPQNPPKYREVVGAFCDAMRKLTMDILEVISEGLGIGRESLKGELSKNCVVSVNHYQPCPNPNLTVALERHCDPTLISILFQDAKGLQFFKDGEWVVVDPIDGALVVHIGYILQVVGNGKLKAGEHQVLANTNISRQSLIYQVYPGDDETIEPAKCLINDVTQPHYRSINFEDFKRDYLSMGGNNEAIMEYLSYNYQH